MTKRIHCLRKSCKKLIPKKRTRYCSPECSYQHRYIDTQLRPKIDKICKFDQCKKIFQGNGLQRYCSAECRIRNQYSVTNNVINTIKNSPALHPCKCCVPPKLISIRQNYCPENAWMKSIPIEDKLRDGLA